MIMGERGIEDHNETSFIHEFTYLLRAPEQKGNVSLIYFFFFVTSCYGSTKVNQRGMLLYKMIKTKHKLNFEKESYVIFMDQEYLNLTYAIWKIMFHRQVILLFLLFFFKSLRHLYMVFPAIRHLKVLFS